MESSAPHTGLTSVSVGKLQLRRGKAGPETPCSLPTNDDDDGSRGSNDLIHSGAIRARAIRMQEITGLPADLLSPSSLASEHHKVHSPHALPQGESVR